MKAVSVKNGYQDPLALKKRRVFMAKIFSVAGLFLVVVAGIVYVVFFSGFLKITEITVDGVIGERRELVENFVREKMDQKILMFIPAQSNITFFDAGDVSAELLGRSPELKSVEITKQMSHRLKISVEERIALGIWCTGFDSEQKCVYFDDEAEMWGSATSSSGFLLVKVDDLGNRVSVEPDTMKIIVAVLEGLKDYLKVKDINIEVVDGADFKVYVNRGYYLRFSFDYDIEKQMRSLKLLLDSKEGDFSFQPQYIDLRIEDRIYWK